MQSHRSFLRSGAAIGLRGSGAVVLVSELPQTLFIFHAFPSINLLYTTGTTMATAVTVGVPLPITARESAQSIHRRKLHALKKRRQELLGEEDCCISIIDFLHHHPHNNNVSHVLDFKEYSLEDMLVATDTFHPSNLLGEGSNGQVFRGVLDGEEIAVKRLPVFARRIAEEEELLVEEIRRIGAVNHRNIMQLLGFCLQGESPLLVSRKLYSLEVALYEDRCLNWEARFQIAVDIAKALAYLHSGTRVQMLHCDIKPGNILLDRDTLKAYIADFGLVHLAHGQGAEEIEISWYYGTRGYRAPEVRSRKRLSAKSDAYSYGKLLYALLSSKEDVEVMPPALVRKKGGVRGCGRVGFKVRIWFLRLFPRIRVLLRRCKLREIERRLEKRASTSGRKILQVSAALRLVTLCTQSDPAMRPSMERVLMELENANVCKIPRAVKTGVAMGFGWYRLLISFLCFTVLVIAFCGSYRSMLLIFAMDISAINDRFSYQCYYPNMTRVHYENHNVVLVPCYFRVTGSTGGRYWVPILAFLWIVWVLLMFWALALLNYLDELLYWSAEEVGLESTPNHLKD